MRSYRVNRIKHNVYDSIVELAPNIKPLREWRKANIGDWVFTDDDCIIQILRRGTMLRKNGQMAYVGTCTGTFTVSKETIMDADKRNNIYSFGGNATPEEVVVNRKNMTDKFKKTCELMPYLPQGKGYDV